jgi:transposase-like protein
MTTKRKKRVYTPEFRSEAVRLFRAGDRTLRDVARDLGVHDSVLRDWVNKAEPAPTDVPTKPLSETERDELLELRKEVRRLREDREILKKAAAFFAKESR